MSVTVCIVDEAEHAGNTVVMSRLDIPRTGPSVMLEGMTVDQIGQKGLAMLQALAAQLKANVVLTVEQPTSPQPAAKVIADPDGQAEQFATRQPKNPSWTQQS